MVSTDVRDPSSSAAGAFTDTGSEGPRLTRSDLSQESTTVFATTHSSNVDGPPKGSIYFRTNRQSKARNREASGIRFTHVQVIAASAMIASFSPDR